ncbi:hypothetical protein [Actinacidiphila soli]|uniref:hypothetical protein n=1 Tax=Actinacidiphila soli TaxID=2487275 RepID=UPI000FC9E78D|nr:hypothetical protein [Actinacidiphila soli]
MLKGLAHAGAWTMATSAAVAMSWFGVHHVLAGTAYDPPRALPITEQAAASASPSASSTSRPAQRKKASPSASATVSSTPEPPKGSSSPATASTGTTGNVHSYPVQGGRVTLDLGETSAALVSATPEAGWQMKVWTQTEWIRVDFTSPTGTTVSSVFCTWNGHSPAVQTYVAGG